VTSELPPIPDALLAPLLDVAGAILRTLPPADFPQQLRALASFDARGLARGAARRQLQRAFDDDETFRIRVVEQFLARPDVIAVRDAWSATDAVQIVAAATVDDSLPLVASMLYAAQPEAWHFALGAACAAEAHAANARAQAQQSRSRASELAAAAEAQRRAEAARSLAEAERDRFEQELRAERRSRRERELATEHAADEVRRNATASEEALARVRAALEASEARTRRDAERSARLERDLAAARRAAAGAADEQALRDVAAETRALATRLDDLAARQSGAGAGAAADAVAATPAVAEAKESRPRRVGSAEIAARSRPRRARPSCPPGLVTDSPAALDAMLRTRGVVLVVDGYNVTKTVWGDAALEEQRERLVAALAELHLRIRCEVVVAFDGADVRIVPGPRRPGVRVLFSAPGETADDVVVREAAAPPETVPVVVASSDAEVKARAADVGAAVVASSVLLAVLRR
jgi:predicted RNA-binding protein with PIN domain